ncbi:XdhC family protein [Carbonactinospora thermoautotrophica]|uniref:XdhC family protein n=1 Tax=Carbonactinospora thermoautotrophica TaxID=1469144 RepID=UPI003DA89076
MKEILDDLTRWHTQGKRVALARVVDVEGSGPRLPGAAMAVNEDGEVTGSVSGGCVEGAVVTEALDILSSGDRKVLTFGYSDDDAFAVGLTCGGTIHLYVEPLDWWELYDEVRQLLVSEEPTALATVIDGPNTGAKLLVRADAAVAPIGTLGDPDLDRVVVRDARGELAAGRTGIRHYGEHGEARENTMSVFIESFVSPPRMLIFGAVDFTAALARVAKVLGYHVTVCDARPVFATRKRFPMADEVVADWPHRLLEKVGPTLGPRDAVCVLTHDAKFDVPAIVTALGTNVGYLGAMGSRRTHAKRVERLREEGVDEAGIARIRAPIGLDLGAQTPEETAIAICAEIIATRAGRTGAVEPLRDGSGRIHT